MTELHPLSTEEIAARLIRARELRRRAIAAEHEAPGHDFARYVSHRLALDYTRECQILGEILGLLSGDPSDPHYYDRLEAWEADLWKDGCKGARRLLEEIRGKTP